MPEKNLTPFSVAEADALYAELIAAQAGLSDEAAADWLARLVLILCHQVGDRDQLRAAFELAHLKHD